MSCIATQSTEPITNVSTVVTAADPQELSPLEALIMDLCNALIEARADHLESAGTIESELFNTIRRYEESGAENHPNPDWAIPNQRALALSAAGRYEDAIETELIALSVADSTRRLEISLGNLAERCMKANRYEEAVAWFLEAQQVAPERVPILLTGAQALFLAGYEDEADAIFGAMLSQPELCLPGTELDAYLRFESRLLGMVDRLPSLRALLEIWRLKFTGSSASEEDRR